MNKFTFLCFMILFAYARNACTGYQSKESCINSKEGCCWFDSTFKGEPFKFCTEHYDEDDEYILNQAYSYLDFDNTNTICSSKKNKCFSIDGITEEGTKSDCLTGDNDCCYIKYDYDVKAKGEYAEYLESLNDFDFGICMANTFGTEKAIQNAMNNVDSSTSTSYGDMDLKIKIDAKCSKSQSTFYSICYEQTEQSGCLKADSNCCWVRSKANVTIGTVSSEAKGESCAFNFFRNATTYKEYAKNTQDKVNSMAYVNVKYDVRCNMHDYALYGASGRVVKDKGDPKITYDSDITGEKGVAPLSSFVKNSGYFNRLDCIFACILLALLL